VQGFAKWVGQAVSPAGPIFHNVLTLTPGVIRMALTLRLGRRDARIAEFYSIKGLRHQRLARAANQ